MAKAKASASGTIKCPHCRQPVPEGSRFCLFCGAPVGSPGTATEQRAETERRQRPRSPSAKAAEPAPRGKPAAEAGSDSTATEVPVKQRPAIGSHRSLLTLGLLAMLIGGVALAAWGFVSAGGGGGEGAGNVRPLARAGLGADGHELALDPGDATTDAITPEDETEPGSGGGDEPDGGGSPPATGVASPDQALAAEFGLAEGETAVPCSAAGFGDALCYLPYLTNLEEGRYLYQVGLPFSEPFAWALVEQQGDGAFATTQTADFDFEGDGTPPFSPGGAMASVTFTSELLDDQPTDRLDDGSNPLPIGSTEVFVFVRYAGLQASDEATITLDWDGSPIGEPSTIDVDPSGDGWATLRIAQDDGTEFPVGTSTVTVLLNGAAIARASLAVLP